MDESLYDNHSFIEHSILLFDSNFSSCLGILFSYMLKTLAILVVLTHLYFVIVAYLIAFYLYLCDVFLKLTKQNEEEEEKYWKKHLKNVAKFFDWQANFYHAHEIVGLEHLPRSGAALLILYHSASPLDVFYAHSKIYLHTQRHVRLIGDRFVYKVPGFGTMLRVIRSTPGTVDSCVDALKNKGDLVLISPGGVREGYFGTRHYKLVWGKRTGFAKIAHQARVPVIPVFTMNCREAIVCVPILKSLFKIVYEWTRLPLIPLLGIFPVKLVTYVGAPIEHDQARTEDELRDLVKLKLEELINKKQRILPGNIFYAICERFFSLNK